MVTVFAIRILSNIFHFTTHLLHLCGSIIKTLFSEIAGFTWIHFFHVNVSTIKKVVKTSEKLAGIISVIYIQSDEHNLNFV